MESNLFFRKVLLPTTLLFIILVCFFSCSQKPKSGDTKEIAEEHNESKYDHSDREKDAQFLVNAAEINLEEIQLGQLALRNASTVEVKELGKMMADEHTVCFEGLKKLADKKLITIPLTPTEDDKEAYEKLSTLTKTDFDKIYTDKMVKGHKAAIALFEKELKESIDTDISAWAKATLPDLKRHLQHAISTQEKLNKI